MAGGVGSNFPFGPADSPGESSTGVLHDEDWTPDLYQVNLNESGSVLTEYLSTSTTGGTVAFDSNEHNGAQSLRIVRTSNALVGARGFTLPGISNNGDAGTAFDWNFWIYVNTLPSSATHVEIASAAFNNADNVLVMLNSAGQVRLSRQNGLTGGALSAPSQTLVTAGSWYQINVTYDFSQLALTTCTLAVNQDAPVFYAITNRYGPNDIHTNVRYGTMTAAVTASTYDICFDDEYVYRTAPSNTLLLYNNENEYSVITSTEYDNVVTTGGTVALSSTQKHSGSQSVRINRTSNNAVYAETLTLTKPSLGPGGLQHAELSGSFWVYVASYPSGVGDTIITTIYHPVNSNLDITLSNTGRVKIRQQDGTLAGGANQSSYSASTVALNTWTQIFWTNHGNTGTMVGTVAVGNDTPVSVTWSQAAEVPPWIDYGSRQMTAASNYDIYFDDQVVYEGAVYPVAAPGGLTFPACTSAGTSTADETAFQIKLPNRTSAGSSTASNNALTISIAFPSSPILDSFTWANGGLSTVNPQWRRLLRSSTTASLNVSSNQVTSTSAPADGYYAGSSFPADQEAYITIASVGSSTFGVELWVRVANPSNPGGNTLNGYFVDYDADQGPSNGALSIARSVNGSVTFLNTITLPSDLSTGDKLGIRVKGSRIEVYTKLGAAPWKQVLALTDTTVTAAGYIGLWVNDSGPPVTFFDDFGGGAYNTFTLPAETSDGTSNATANNLKIRLPAVTSAGTSGATATGLRIKLPSRTSAGVATADETPLLIKLPNRTSAGTGSVSANNIKIKLPNRTSAGSSAGTTATVLMSILPVESSSGTSTATATALRIRLPSRTSAGTSTFTQGGLKIRLPGRTSAGTSSIAQSGLRDKLSPLTSAGSSSASATGLKIRLPNLSSAGTSTATTSGLKHIRLPSQTSAGTSTAIAVAFRIRLPSRTSAGTGTSQALITLRLPSRTSAGTSTATATALRIQLPSRTSAGTGTATATAFRIRLPSRTSAGTGTVTAPLSIRLPAVSTAGGTGISLVRDHGINGSASASTTLTIPTTAAVAAGDYLVITGTSSSGTATLVSIAVTSGTDPGNLSWTGWDAIGNATGAFIAWTRCPTGVNNGVTFTITWSGVAFGTRRAGLTEWSGIASSGAQDAHQAAVSSSSSTNPTVNITTAGPNEVVIAGISIQTATTLTPNGTFLEIHDDNGGSRTHGTIYQLETSSGTYAPGATAASNNHWAISSIALVGAPIGGSGSNAQATGLKIRLPSRTSAGTSTADETALQLSGGAAGLLSVTSSGTSTATAAALRIRLPSRSSSGTGATSAPLAIRLPNRSSAGTSSAVGNNLRIRLPNLTSAGTATCTANNIKIKLPNRTSAGTSTATAVGLRPKLPNRTSAGTSTATATAFKIRLPSRTSAGVGTTSTTNLAGAVSNLQNVTSNGTGSCSANNLKIKLPSRSSAGSATCTASLRIRFPNRSSAGTSTTAQGGLKIRFASRTSAGTSTCTATALKVRLPIRTSAGTGTATAQAFRIRLPSRASAGQATTTVTSLASGLVAQSHGSSTCTATAFKIRLPSRTSSGTSNITQAGLRDRIALAVSSGQSTCTATGFRIKLPARTTVGTSSTLGRLATRLPARTSAGSSTATSGFLRVGFHSFSSGSSSSSAQAFRIKLPSQFSNGTSDVFARRFLYIPPPAKVVISSSSSHVLTSSTAGHLVVASGPATSGSVTASSSSAVTPAGDLTKTVTASK